MQLQTNVSIIQSLQIAAFVPCIFLVVYLASHIRNGKFAIIPVLYFTSIAAGLAYSIVPILGLPIIAHINVSFILILADSFIAAISFLLIIQLAFNNVPSSAYWSILLVPALAMSPFVYAFLNETQLCTSDIDVCFSSLSALHLNRAIVASFIFMLLVVIFSRRSVEIEGEEKVRRNKYWIIICLIIYSLVLIALDISYAAEFISKNQYSFAKVMVKIAFIYIVMTSIFRIFEDQFEIDTSGTISEKTPLSEYELSVGQRIEKILISEKIYRELGFNRAFLAKRIGVREHVLSRIINMYFNKSFSELANMYRVGEAKDRLANTNDAITSIAYDVGFSSITSFNRVFKELAGSSASDYRLNNKKA